MHQFDHIVSVYDRQLNIPLEQDSIQKAYMKSFFRENTFA